MFIFKSLNGNKFRQGLFVQTSVQIMAYLYRVSVQIKAYLYRVSVQIKA